MAGRQAKEKVWRRMGPQDTPASRGCPDPGVALRGRLERRNLFRVGEGVQGLGCNEKSQSPVFCQRMGRRAATGK